MTTYDNPPRTFGTLLAILGLALLLGGINLMHQGDNSYFCIVGLGILTSGVFIALGKVIGAWIYLGIFVTAIAWSFIEVGLNTGMLLPRLLFPAALCVYIFSGSVRPRLS